MRRRRGAPSLATQMSGFAGFRFPPEVILLAVRWYLRYGLSYRDLEELLAERGIVVDHVTLYRWVQRFTPIVIAASRPCRHSVGDRWFIDETYVKVAGVWRYVYRAVDQYGQVIDVFVSLKRDTKAAHRFFTTSIRSHGVPTVVTTDRSAALARASSSWRRRPITTPPSTRTAGSKLGATTNSVSTPSRASQLPQRSTNWPEQSEPNTETPTGQPPAPPINNATAPVQ